MYNFVKKTQTTISMSTLVWISSCAQIPSSDVKTENIKAQYEVNVDRNGSTQVTATFTTGDGPGFAYVDLSGQDQAVCFMGETEIEMDKSSNSILGYITYHCKVSEYNEEVKVVLKRGRENHVALVNPPAPIKFIKPKNNRTHVKGQDLDLEWSGPSETVKISIYCLANENSPNEIDCNHHFSTMKSSYKIPGDKLKPINPNTDIEIIEDVNAIITASMATQGTMPSSLNGSIEATTRDELNVILIDE